MKDGSTAPDWASTIRIFRILRGISQEDLAHAAGISSSYVSLLETGRRGEPTEKTLRRIAEALDVEASLMRLIACARAEPWTIDAPIREALARSFIDLLFPFSAASKGKVGNEKGWEESITA